MCVHVASGLEWLVDPTSKTWIFVIGANLINPNDPSAQCREDEPLSKVLMAFKLYDSAHAIRLTADLSKKKKRKLYSSSQKAVTANILLSVCASQAGRLRVKACLPAYLVELDHPVPASPNSITDAILHLVNSKNRSIAFLLTCIFF